MTTTAELIETVHLHLKTREAVTVITRPVVGGWQTEVVVLGRVEFRGPVAGDAPSARGALAGRLGGEPAAGALAPRYPREGAESVFLGTVLGEGRWHDLYWDRELPEPHLEARYGARPDERDRAPMFTVSRDPDRHGTLGIAYRLAQDAARR